MNAVLMITQDTVWIAHGNFYHVVSGE